MNASRYLKAAAGTAFGALLGVGLVIAVIALARRGDARLTIAIHQGVEGVALKQVISAFAAKERVPVDVVELPYEQLFAAEVEQLKSTDSIYDVIMADDPWMPALNSNGAGLKRIEIGKGMCGRIGDFMPRLLWVSREPYSEDPVKCSDSFYALPFVGNSQLFVFKKTQASEKPATAPATWDEAIETSGYVMRVGPGNPIVTDFMPMLWSVSKDIFPSKGGKELSLPPSAAQAFGYLSTLGSRPGNLGIISYDDFDLAIQMANGQATMSIVWSAWAMAMARLPEPQRARLLAEVEFGQIPGSQPELGAWLLAIPGNARYQAEASAFIAYATGNVQLRQAAEIGNPPPVMSVLQDKELQKRFPSFNAQLISLKNARPRPRTPHWASVEQVLGRCLSAAYESALVFEPEGSAARGEAIEEANMKLVDRSNAAIKMAMSGRSIDGFSCMKD